VERSRAAAGGRAQLVAQQNPQVLVGGERPRDLATGAQRLHQQPVARLAQRRRQYHLARGALSRREVRAAERAA